MFAFDYSPEDVIASIPEFSVSEQRALELMGQLDDGEIEKAALYGDDLDIQTNYAHAEISKQVHAMIGAERMAQLIANQMVARLNPDMAKNAMEEAAVGLLDELVFEHIGTSKSISNSINNAGFIVQATELIKVMGYAPFKKALEDFWEFDILPLAI